MRNEKPSGEAAIFLPNASQYLGVRRNLESRMAVQSGQISLSRQKHRGRPTMRAKTETSVAPLRQALFADGKGWGMGISLRARR